TTVELEMISDGASAAQLPALTFPQSPDVQVFADPPQAEVQLVDGRPRTTMRQRVSIVPLHAGALSLTGPSVQWWDAMQGIARTATLPPLALQVAPAVVASDAGRDAGSDSKLQPSAAPGARDHDASPATHALAGFRHLLPLLAAMLALVVLVGWWWFARHRKAGMGAIVAKPPTTHVTSPKAASLADALKAGELAGIAVALCNTAGLPGEDLDVLRMRLDDAAQAVAVDQLQAARWGVGDSSVALASLRAAFAKGLKLRSQRHQANTILPPLYPQS
ncbi:MAG: protein BatD, partial [Thermomonas sp.]